MIKNIVISQTVRCQDKIACRHNLIEIISLPYLEMIIPEPLIAEVARCTLRLRIPDRVGVFHL